MNASVTALEHGKNVGIIALDPRPLPAGARALRPTLLTAGQSRYEEYREHAAECHEIANRWSDLIKDQYEGLACQWLMLAKQERPF
jgi:hypothetical protein